MLRTCVSRRISTSADDVTPELGTFNADFKHYVMPLRVESFGTVYVVVDNGSNNFRFVVMYLTVDWFSTCLSCFM